MGGLFGLLDDVAALARLAAASLDDIGAAAGRATTKAAGVLIDDAAVTPQYVQGLAAARELPIIGRIAKGSIRNKMLFVLPVLLVLSEFAEWLLAPLLLVGGGYLCYEAVHKIWMALTGAEHGHGGAHAEDEPRSEEELVAGAIRTDLILSAEIMTIAVRQVAGEDFGFIGRGVVLAVVAVAITIIVYGAVALIVKMDDVGLRLSTGNGPRAALGRRLVTAMPALLAALSVIGTAAMLWVGGHIWIVELHELGFDPPYDLLHAVVDPIRESAGAAGGVLAWLADTAMSAVFGLLVGTVVVAVQQAIARARVGDAVVH